MNEIVSIEMDENGKLKYTDSAGTCITVDMCEFATTNTNTCQRQLPRSSDSQIFRAMCRSPERSKILNTMACKWWVDGREGLDEFWGANHRP